MITTIGHQFSEARRSRKLEFEDVFRATGIPVKFLSALESGNFRIFGGRMYVMRYVRQYALFLDIAADQIVDAATREWEVYALRVAWHTRGPSAMKKFLLQIKRHAVLGVVVAGFVLPMGGYFGYQLSLLLSAPDLFVTVPASEISRSVEGAVTIGGTVKERARLSINRRPVALRERGQFEERLYLAPGLNTIEIEAINVSGRSLKEVRHIFYQP
ncbi:MAG: helix-turn-helix domain-containing protein [Candidatus Sungbacteria bacterium]|nr:helix-turn-helix domain-containing protein [Candidatus Sungbacteria bacterium]